MQICVIRPTMSYTDFFSPISSKFSYFLLFVVNNGMSYVEENWGLQQPELKGSQDKRGWISPNLFPLGLIVYFIQLLSGGWDTAFSLVPDSLYTSYSICQIFGYIHICFTIFLGSGKQIKPEHKLWSGGHVQALLTLQVIEVKLLDLFKKLLKYYYLILIMIIAIRPSRRSIWYWCGKITCKP